MSKAKEWASAVTGGMSLRDLANAIGGTHSTVGRKLDNDDPQMIVEIAKHFGANPVGVLISIEFLNPRDVRNYAAVSNLENYDDLELAEEIVRRLREREDHEALHGNIFELSDYQSAPTDTHDGTVTEWDGSKPAAADSSPDENEERIKRGEDPID